MHLLNTERNKNRKAPKPTAKNLDYDDIICIYPPSDIVLETDSWEEVVINPARYCKDTLY